MTEPEIEVDAATRRSARLAVLVAELTQEHWPLAPTMTKAEFDAMIQRMAEQQVLYEEFGDER
jgi:hypothetical protein